MATRCDWTNVTDSRKFYKDINKETGLVTPLQIPNPLNKVNISTNTSHVYWIDAPKHVFVYIDHYQ